MLSMYSVSSAGDIVPPFILVPAVLFALSWLLYKVIVSTHLGLQTKLIKLEAAYGTDIPKIKGIPEMPGAAPFLGHLHLHAGVSGKSDAGLWTYWGKVLKTDLLQVKFGQNRVVIANSWDAVREIFVTNANKTSARPRQFVFERYIGK